MRDGIKSIKRKYATDVEVLSQYSSIILTKGEDNLYERFQKAVDHLATFCPKKAEAF